MGARAVTKARPAGYAVGQDVKAEYKGTWYNACILEIKDGSYLIGYDGYGKESDEWVGLDRLRPR